MTTPRDVFPKTEIELLNYYYNYYDSKAQQGDIYPYVLPFTLLGSLMVICYLLIPHQHSPWLRNGRYLVFAANSAFTAWILTNMRAREPIPAVGIGLIAGWGVVWSFELLVARDVQVEFIRIERLERVLPRGKEMEYMGIQKQREKSNGECNSKSPMNGTAATYHDRNLDSSLQAHSKPEYIWQPYPLSSFPERIDWVFDLYTNFRGRTWNWRIPMASPPPTSVLSSLRHNSPYPVSKLVKQSPSTTHQTKPHRYAPPASPDRHTVLLTTLRTLTKGYLTLDTLKTIMQHDPYFWGIQSISHPPPNPPPFPYPTSPFLLRSTRLLISQLAIQQALTTLFTLSPLFYILILPSLPLPPFLTTRARTDPWADVPTFGPYPIPILERGLAGWWGGWWHQTFRAGFLGPSNFVIRILHLDSRSLVAKILQLVSAFSLSAFVHACGSYTQLGTTEPGNGVLFFELQVFGIVVEALFLNAHSPFLPEFVKVYAAKLPDWLKQGLRFAYTYLWFYVTAPLLCDDIAKGGIWLMEPVPFSLWTGLGFGMERGGWWRWGSMIPRLVRGGWWWLSGLGF